jgi:hypothetical protein
MAWRRRGGRKVIVAPPGCDDWAPPSKIDDALVKALARAHRWQRMLETGEHQTLADLADAERIKSLLRLPHRPPHIARSGHRRANPRRPADPRLAPGVEAIPSRVGEAAAAIKLSQVCDLAAKGDRRDPSFLSECEAALGITIANSRCPA